MQTPLRKKHVFLPRKLLLPGLLLLCLVLGALLFWSSRPAEPAPASHHHDPITLTDYSSDDVVFISVRLRTGQGWTVVQREDGKLTLEEDPSFIVDSSTAAMLLAAAADLEAPAVLADHPDEYKDRLTDFGLTDPRLIAEITYADGASVTLRAGDSIITDDQNRLYLIMDGDDRLFAMDKGTVDLFTLDRSLLRAVTQPTLHADRFDRITLTGADGIAAEWALQGSITDSDAYDRWQLVQPFAYPADGSALSALRDHIASLRLGAYVAEATPEHLSTYGFDQPRMVLSLHQAAGNTGAINAAGEYEIVSWPESTLTLTLGGAMNQDIDYLLFDGAIYTGSHYALNRLLTLNVQSTLTRYPVTTALGNLTRLTIVEDGSVRDYVITRTEQVAENNDLITDAQGNILYDYAVSCNGKSVGYTAFEAAYLRLITTTVSGLLPDRWTTTEAPHTTLTFHDRSGDVRVISLVPYDALHDAVLIDGQALFYLIRGGLVLTLEESSSP